MDNVFSFFLAHVCESSKYAFFFSSVSQILSNFILLIHFSTDWSIDSHNLFNLNSWDSQSSKSSAKILQNIFKSCKILQKFCKCCKSSANVAKFLHNFCKSSAKITKVPKVLQKFCKSSTKVLQKFQKFQMFQKFQKFCKHCKSSAKVLQKFCKSSVKALQKFCKISKSSVNVANVLQNFQKFCKIPIFHTSQFLPLFLFLFLFLLFFFLSLSLYFSPWLHEPRIKSF